MNECDSDLVAIKTVQHIDAVASIDTLVSEIDKSPIDRESIPQSRLDLANRSRRSLFPWRGQFSPELIELLLATYAGSGSTVVDPFVGSGTALFEAARKSLMCYGAEINPAAVIMARTAHFVNKKLSEREDYIRRAQTIIEKNITTYQDGPLFSLLKHKKKESRQSLEESFQNMLREAAHIPLVYDIVANTIIRYTTLRGREDSMSAFFRAFKEHRTIIEQLPYSRNLCRLFHCDARNLPLESGSIGFIVTSPPYINVFNYHQNYRRAMELMGWDLLRIARSEFGSNRKNRGNRFLTVVQYAIDMLQALCEMRRVLRPSGRIVTVLGRESKVRGISFQNGQIVAALAVGGANLRLILRQERKFTNKFGELIYEDLLHFIPLGKPQQASDDFAKAVARYVLNKAASRATNDVYNDIQAASQGAVSVQASPRFEYPDIIL